MTPGHFLERLRTWASSDLFIRSLSGLIERCAVSDIRSG